jgi:hypothetical protein
MPVSRRTLLPALLGAIAGIPRLARAADDVITRASPYSPLPEPESEPARRSLPIGKSLIELSVEGRKFTVSPGYFADWVTDCADIVTQYYGEFPIPSVDVRISGARGNRVLTGQAMPTTSGAVVNVLVGLSASKQTLARDWVMIHELIHLAFPSVHRRHQWLTEGLATYVESIARAQAGALTADQVWLGFLDGMPKGLPRAGDKGLDYTPTWGRTYWGGALYCLLADIDIRARTDNDQSLRDGLRAIVAADYHMMKVGEVSDVLAIADTATGVDVLNPQYERMRDQPLPAEIDSLWQRLGVARSGGRVIYDDQAPQAHIRQALTRA